MKVLVTRPAEDARGLAASLAALGLAPLIQPLLDIRFRTGPALDLAGIGGFLVTSGNGVRALAARTTERALPLWAVGEHSADLARDHGFTAVSSAAGDVEALVALVASRYRPADGTLIHAAGTTTAGDLKGRLAALGFQVTVAPLYDAVPATGLAREVAAALDSRTVSAVLLFSPRTARIWADLLRRQGRQDQARDLDAWCLSPAVAAAIAEIPHRSVHSAATPSTGALLSAIRAALTGTR